MSSEEIHPPTQSTPKNPQLRRSPSPSQTPKTKSAEDSVYVLTLHTDRDHHQRMTALRSKYFPPEINKLAAHLTLFHALPESKLDTSILPTIKSVAAGTDAFDLRATQPFKLKRGIAISVSAQQGGSEAQKVHRALQQPWLEEGILSQQDSGRKSRIHYTIMNKVDDQEVIDHAFEDVTKRFSGDRGRAVGLALYRYDRGFWRLREVFPFRSQ